MGRGAGEIDGDGGWHEDGLPAIPLHPLLSPPTQTVVDDPCSRTPALAPLVSLDSRSGSLSLRSLIPTGLDPSSQRTWRVGQSISLDLWIPSRSE